MTRCAGTIKAGPQQWARCSHDATVGGLCPLCRVRAGFPELKRALDHDGGAGDREAVVRVLEWMLAAARRVNGCVPDCCPVMGLRREAD